MNELPIPEAALRDKNSVEMLRAWIAERQLHCAIKVGFYDGTIKTSEARAWGITLADVARHLANALEERSGADRAKVIEEIRNGFLREPDKPTSEATGEFAKPDKS
jgi:hypothetical protein